MKRYVAVKENGEQIGIFHMLDLLEQAEMTSADYGVLDWAEYKLNLELVVPEYKPGVKTEAWFTDRGVQHFEEAITILGELVNRYLDEYHFLELSVDVINNAIMYSDEYQVVYIIKGDSYGKRK